MTKKLLVLITLAFISAVCSCGGSDSAVTPASSDSAVTPASIDLYSNMKATTPVFAVSSASASFQSRSLIWGSLIWGYENPLYSVFYSLRSFTYPDDEGKVDRSNIYKLIFDAQTILNTVLANATAITPQEISSPFPGIDTTGIKFDHAIISEDDEVSGAYLTDGNVIRAIVSWRWTEESSPNKDEIGVARIDYNRTSGDISIDMVFSVDYAISDDARDYNMRCRVSGNMTDHTFKFKYRIDNQDIIAQGVSSGEGKYMLFRYSSSSDTYIVVPAGSGEDYFKNSPTTYTSTSSLPAEVSEYVTWVSSEAAFTDSDMFTKLSSLTGGSYLIQTK